MIKEVEQLILNLPIELSELFLHQFGQVYVVAVSDSVVIERIFFEEVSPLLLFGFEAQSCKLVGLDACIGSKEVLDFFCTRDPFIELVAVDCARVVYVDNLKLLVRKLLDANLTRCSESDHLAESSDATLEELT